MPRFDKRAADALVWLLLLTAPFWLRMSAAMSSSAAAS